MVSCRRWFDQTYPQYALLRWHSAMGARMYARECQKLKQMGAITGQPDWTLMVQSYDGKWHTLNLEFKRPGNDPAQYAVPAAGGSGPGAYSGGPAVQGGLLASAIPGRS